jgi:phosphate uptake regulator
LLVKKLIKNVIKYYGDTNEPRKEKEKKLVEKARKGKKNVKKCFKMRRSRAGDVVKRIKNYDRAVKFFFNLK